MSRGRWSDPTAAPQLAAEAHCGQLENLVHMAQCNGVPDKSRRLFSQALAQVLGGLHGGGETPAMAFALAQMKRKRATAAVSEIAWETDHAAGEPGGFILPEQQTADTSHGQRCSAAEMRDTALVLEIYEDPPSRVRFWRWSIASMHWTTGFWHLRKRSRRSDRPFGATMHGLTGCQPTCSMLPHPALPQTKQRGRSTWNSPVATSYNIINIRQPGSQHE
jgi:hypothetical protein